MNNVPKRYNTYTNTKNITFDKVSELAFKKDELMNNLGHFVNETNREKSFFFDDEFTLNNGVYIYQDYNNPNIAYRIYKQFADYGFNGNKDDYLIQELQSRKDNIKLTDLPFGVVTLEGNIIGQQIPYYPNHMTLYECFKNSKVNNPYEIYLSMLDILKELFDNNIIYFDNHAKNFLINDNQIKLIDFDFDYILFNNSNMRCLKKMLDNYIYTINLLNRLYTNTDNIIFEQTNSIEETYDQVRRLQRKIA